jgi:uncharacterized protein YnzC (UPF0291/DUF896 family)
MITPEMISRINELARKQKEGALSEEERTEQTQLRRLYIDNIKNQVKVHLDSQKEHANSDNCSCGCNHKH